MLSQKKIIGAGPRASHFGWGVRPMRLISLALCLTAASLGVGAQSWIDVSAGYAPEALAKMLPPDALRSIDAPVFLPLAQAAERLPFLDDEDLLISVERFGVRKLYPIKALVWHEIVNDRFGTEGIVVSYCILTGSPVVFLAEAVAPSGELTPHTFGVSGYLYESNLVMFDRQTGSTWPQLALQAISGKERGKFLSPLPYGLIRWGRAKIELPDTPVLCGDARVWMKDPMIYAGRMSPRLIGYETSPDFSAPVSPAILAEAGTRAKVLLSLNLESGEVEAYAGGELEQGETPRIVLYRFAHLAFRAARLLP